MSFLQHQLAYNHDTALLFERIAHEPWAMLLDSGQKLNKKEQPGSQYGRYDILVARPFMTIVATGNEVTIDGIGKEKIVSHEDPFAVLNKVISQYQAQETDWPFVGGALGYFAYDLGRNIEKIHHKNKPEEMPDLMVGIYDWAVVVDHRERQTLLLSHGFSKETHAQWSVICELFDAPTQTTNSQFMVSSTTKSNLTEVQYLKAFNRIKDYIDAGDCYQVNLAQRFHASVEGDSWVAYKKLRDISPAPFMAYMQLPFKDAFIQVLSNSPERFVQVIGDHVETRPIKGTRPRATNQQADLALANELQASIKDQAENLMIVDLLRNDIGKTCEVGSVKVEKLFQLQSFANVHHLVSIITAKLNSNATVIDLLRGCFPGGSITGAPKVRSMEIIEELEPNSRGIYCGAIGYIGFDGRMDTNIAIRTAVVRKNVLSYYAGGGIVADSNGQKEYFETFDKASTMVSLLDYFRHHCS